MSNGVISDFQTVFVKQPAEELPIFLDFSERLTPYFEEIVTASLTAEKSGIDSPEIISPGEDILSSSDGIIEAPYLTRVKVTLVGGDINYDYRLTCRVETRKGAKLEKEFTVRVREL